MSDQVTPAVQEQAPEKSAREMLEVSDAQFLEAIGITPKAEEKPVAEKVEEKKEEPVVVAKPDEVTKPDEAAPADEEAPVDEAKPEEKKPEPKVYDFKISDKEGELEVPEDLTFTFTANGKVRENVPLTNVLKLAQMGYYNHEREQALKSVEGKAELAQQEAAQLKAVLDDSLARMKRALAE